MAFYSLIQAWMFYLKIKKCKAIVPSFTFSGTVNALILNNIEPIFCDINETLTINTSQSTQNNNIFRTAIVNLLRSGH
jgi:dTDP-4-amino-4,6-dideoxygalactose transaminase